MINTPVTHIGIGIGGRYVGSRILVLIYNLGIRVFTTDGELLRQLQLDPKPDRDYQPQPHVNDVPRHPCTVSRNIATLQCKGIYDLLFRSHRKHPATRCKLSAVGPHLRVQVRGCPRSSIAVDVPIDVGPALLIRGG